MSLSYDDKRAGTTHLRSVSILERGRLSLENKTLDDNMDAAHDSEEHAEGTEERRRVRLKQGCSGGLLTDDQLRTRDFSVL